MPSGLLETFAGGKPLTVTLAGHVLDTDRVGPVAIRRGRRSADTRPEAAVLGFSIYADGLDVLGRLPELGDALTVELSAAMLTALGGGPTHARRFTGTVTDVASRASAGVVSIIATGAKARAARIPIGDVPWPAELDGARAARILAALVAADPSFTVLAGDPGTVTVVARDVDRQPVAALLDELAAYTGGDAWETRAGALVWRDARSRSDLNPTLTLAASNILVDPEFTKDLDGLVTDLTVGYGTAEPQVEVRVRDTTAPIAALAARVSTPLAAEGDATAYAIEVVGRRARPRWRVPDLPLDLLHTLDAAQRLTLLAAEPGLLIALTGLPDPAPWSANQLWVEGWTETYTRNAWRMALAVSVRGLTGAQPRWIDVPATRIPGPGLPAQNVTWADAEFAGMSWLAMAGWWTEDRLGNRWADVPASLTWGTYPSTTTWGDLP